VGACLLVAAACFLVDHDVHRTDDFFGDIFLDCERITQRSVIGLRPQLRPISRGDKLCSDADLIALAPHAALQRVGNALRPILARAAIPIFARETIGYCSDH
jgi:hypothetical protein